MLDTSGSMTLTIGLLKQAAEQFIIRLLPEDKARIGAFNDKIQINAKWSNDRDQLVTDIKDLDYGNGTRLWDAVGTALDELKSIDGRRVILVFTDGDDTESRAMSLGKVIERARVDEVMIYAIGLESRYAIDGRVTVTKPDSGLRKVADETGGGYSPTQLDNRVHKLTVKMKQPGMTARARRSYLAAADKTTISK